MSRVLIVAVAVLTLAGAGAAVRSQGSASQVSPVVVDVPAERPWSDSGVTVKKGDELSFCATGEVRFTRGNAASGPAGVGDLDPLVLPMRMLPVGALVGSVNGVTFPIGANTRMIKMPDSGRLLLGINDWVFTDNSGSFKVRVSRSLPLKAKDCSAI